MRAGRGPLQGDGGRVSGGRDPADLPEPLWQTPSGPRTGWGGVGFSDALLGADSPKLPPEITVCYFLCVWPLGQSQRDRCLSGYTISAGL